jgi:hypothetical protein
MRAGKGKTPTQLRDLAFDEAVVRGHSMGPWRRLSSSRWATHCLRCRATLFVYRREYPDDVSDDIDSDEVSFGHAGAVHVSDVQADPEYQVKEGAIIGGISQGEESEPAPLGRGHARASLSLPCLGRPQRQRKTKMDSTVAEIKIDRVPKSEFKELGGQACNSSSSALASFRSSVSKPSVNQP